MQIREEEKIFDEVKITTIAGNGGNGCCSFRREKFIDNGGPDGGDGGRGGDIILKATPSINTLIKYRFKKVFKAKDGSGGSGAQRTGQSGEDLILEVPAGTQVFMEGGVSLIHDFAKDGNELKLASGGSGGLGNFHFKSSVTQAPRRIIPGGQGETVVVELKLKMICDIGLIGMPNAGKSSFLASITNARPKIANYAFTTISPNLGVFEINYKQIIIADIPGLIEGASEGKGLGQKFLKHIERCKILFHLVDIADENFIQNYKSIRNEILSYDYQSKIDYGQKNTISEKPEIVILNKIDLLSKSDAEERLKNFRKECTEKVFLSSNFLKPKVLEIMQDALKLIENLEES